MTLKDFYLKLKNKIFNIFPFKLKQPIVDALIQQNNFLSTIKGNLKGEIKKYSDKEIIFHKGDLGNHIFFIITGTVHIVFPDKKEPTILHKGQMFGELAILEQKQRAGTAIAIGDTELFAINREVFNKLYQSSAEFRNYTDTLSEIYHIPHRGIVSISSGFFNKMSAITILYQINNRTITANKILEKPLFTMTEENIKGSQSIVYTINEDNLRQLFIRDNRMVGLITIGSWPDLGYACQILLDKKKLDDDQIALFKKNGQLREEAAATDDIICYCMNVTKNEILKLKQHYQENEIIEKTGASLVCGGCKTRLDELIKKK